MTWETIERPGYFGKKREELVQRWDTEFGQDNWRVGYEWKNTVVDRDFAIQLYEDGYYEHLKSNPDIVDWLSTYAEVYDTAPTNVAAGLSYDVQETPSNHVHDVSIRRSFYRLGREFTGTDLLEVRGKKSEGAKLSPGVVPFHLPEMISDEPIQTYGHPRIWWDEGSIEDFYQRNKLLQKKTE